MVENIFKKKLKNPMDSLYEAPRQPPAIFSKEMLTGTPVVPEISVLCPSNGPKNVFTTYNQWRQGHENPHLRANKENLPFPMSQNSSILKKQVRFDSPVTLSKLPENAQSAIPKRENIPKFEHMYMANIPSRQLDLSLIEPARQPEEVPVEAPRAQQEPEKIPKSYKEFLEEQQKANNRVLNDSVTDIFNYKRTTSVDAPQSFQSRRISSGPPPSCNNNPDESLRPFQSVSHLDYLSQRTGSQSVQNSNNNQLRYAHSNGSEANKSEQNVENRFNGQKSCSEAANRALPRLNNQTNSPEQLRFKSRSCGCCSGTERSTELETIKPKTQDDLSVKDLLQIITQQSQQIIQQNNQIMLLQQQVTELVSMQRNQVEDQRTHCCQFNSPPTDSVETIQQRCISSTQPNQNLEEGKFFNKINQENNCVSTNFSIGMTTSYEVSVIRPSLKNSNNFLPMNAKDCERNSPQIKEIAERGNVKDTLVDASMVFKEPIEVRETCPSPEPSIKINMKDFDDSDSDDNDDSSSQSDTFYKNLMAQVNKVLQKAHIETSKELANMGSPNLNQKTLHKVKETTMRHLRRIGVDLQNESSGNSSVLGKGEGVSYNEDDVSFMVKQLLMKYLPADHLAKLAAKGPQYTQKDVPNVGVIKTRPDFSFATLQYMKKYNLISTSNNEGRQKQQAGQSPKILDISNLKQQPKLL
ncbi:uncharacterized protein LOC109539241 [Dendroctonus ponderosae]|uniref:uncharacterized protein LOC109539241 n=1 Tax=Dendroctonus ponderosae TaxID=77166 RepID=UPI002035D7C5|nr:uncharacterized protein LOC109539241 [Dendroctonus ponderosae]KAH1012431.1 hypothetical protein HUJ05_011594 [Dendroctonus ponderosae]